MKLGIIGTAGAGKTTLLSLLSGIPYESSLRYQLEKRFHYVAIRIPDERLLKIWETQQDKNMVQATMEITDSVPLSENPSERKSNNMALASLREVDGIILVIPCYQKREDTEWVTAEIERIKTDILLSDLEIIERRLDKIKHQKGRGSLSPSEIHEEQTFLNTLKEYIESGKNQKDITLTSHTEQLCKTYGFLSRKPISIILNISELDLSLENKYIKVTNQYRCVWLPLKLEYEMSLLSPEEQQDFLTDYGLKSLQRDKVLKLCYEILELCTFFTIGKDEVRSWAIKNGGNILVAAGKVHTDMARGFIAADVVSFPDWLNNNSSIKIAKERGKLRTEGKDYVVKDGDIIHLKFNI
ncbi:MAG: DUF933 domain-containing protein [Planctomycetota bacterium]|nr:DUF933 domain-containing protein [Planctomycetota bacterium]MDI6787603.1 DUF933 domain-containing protein [Planctomycetota bacterium]